LKFTEEFSLGWRHVLGLVLRVKNPSGDADNGVYRKYAVRGGIGAAVESRWLNFLLRFLRESIPGRAHAYLQGFYVTCRLFLAFAGIYVPRIVLIL
jgi:hypothetical protein